MNGVKRIGGNIGRASTMLHPIRFLSLGARTILFNEGKGGKMNLGEWHGLIKECRGLLKSKDKWAALAESTRKDYKQKAAALNGRLPSQAANM